LVALDERGRMLSSEAFAGLIGKVRDNGAKTAAILIGGADGLGPDVLAKANAKVSFGAITLPHQLARIVLAEQLYRAAAILAGHPYHRG
jgi:23S rRNA (pseudouridine1915-N3)-methyltransferase